MPVEKTETQTPDQKEASQQKVCREIPTDRRTGVRVCIDIEIRCYGKKVAKKLATKDFKASPDWCYEFMRRKGLSIHRRTHISQKLPEDYEGKFVEFQKFIIKQCQLHD